MMSVAQLASTMEYPGRFLILGGTKEHGIAVYGVTARSASSRAKRYVFSNTTNTIHVVSTDQETMAQGNLDLLDYTAVRCFDNGLVIGNGRQTEAIVYGQSNAVDQLTDGLKNETYEPDKYSTPRITGCITKNNDIWSGALHIIRDDGSGNSVRDCFNVPCDKENTYFISTYAGPNIRPTPSFLGAPICLDLLPNNPEEAAEYIYEAFAPLPGNDDVRVSVIAVFLNKDSRQFIFRRHFAARFPLFLLHRPPLRVWQADFPFHVASSRLRSRYRLTRLISPR